MHNMPHTEESKQKMRDAHLGKPQYHKRRPMIIINGVDHYRCGRCGNFYPIEGFYKNKRTILGITSECRKCHSKTAIESRNKDNAREKNKLYKRQLRKRNPEVVRARERKCSQQRTWNEKMEARYQLNLAIRRKEIAKPHICEECGQKVKLTAHHEDYSKPLEVRWLCYECHGKRHRQIP